MKRLVFQLADSVAPDDTPYVAISLTEPSIFGSRAQPFGCTGQEQQFVALRSVAPDVEAIQAAGRYLYDAVIKHPELAAHLATALQTQQPERYPVYVEIATGSGIETLPWETLCSANGEFLGLDERWAVGRIVDGPARTSSFHQFQPPLRVAAVLSCLGIPAADEWSALLAAVSGQAAVDVELLVLVSEPDLHAQVSEFVASSDGPPTRVELVSTQLHDVQEVVAGFRPHVLHFFCHGSARGSPHLQISVKSDWVTGAPENSLLVEARDVRAFTRPTDDLPWLVVLNCCESAGAGSGENVQSLALRLVYEGGIPAVVGMREPVLSEDASLFTRAFYTRLLHDLGARLTDGAGDRLVDWAQLVVEARTQLARKHKALPLSAAAASTREWTMPVVYVGRSPFTVHATTTAPPDTAVVPAAPSPSESAPPAPAPTLPPSAPEPSAEEPPSLAQPVEEVPADVPTSTRAVRLEVEALRGMLDQLPPDSTPPELLDDISRRLAVLVPALRATPDD